MTSSLQLWFVTGEGGGGVERVAGREVRRRRRIRKITFLAGAADSEERFGGDSWRNNSLPLYWVACDECGRERMSCGRGGRVVGALFKRQINVPAVQITFADVHWAYKWFFFFDVGKKNSHIYKLWVRFVLHICRNQRHFSVSASSSSDRSPKIQMKCLSDWLKRTSDVLLSRFAVSSL